MTLEQIFGDKVKQYAEKIGKEVADAILIRGGEVADTFAKELGYESVGKLKEDLVRYTKKGAAGITKLLEIARNFEQYSESVKAKATELADKVVGFANAEQCRVTVDVKRSRATDRKGRYNTAAKVSYKP